MQVTNRFSRTPYAVALALACAHAAAQPASNAGFTDGDWWTINRDAGATRFAPLAQIDRTNVARLAPAWTYPLAGNSTAVPLVVKGIMYVPSGGTVVALDAGTGEVVWSQALGRGMASGRGVAYWPGDADHAPRIVLTAGNNLVALDAATGAPIQSFGNAGFAPMGVGYGAVPTIYRHVAIIGAANGEVPTGPSGNSRAFDVRTGAKLWEFSSVAQPGSPGHETWLDEGWRGLSGANMWAFSAPVDAERGLVYLPLSSPTPNYYGGARPGANLYGNSIVAVDAVSGEYRWHFQTVHHDLWDADMPSAGALFEFTAADGRRVPAIGHVGKTSYFFVLDRTTGQPLIPVEERSVPKGDVPGEWYSPTQPFPVRPEPLSRVSFDIDKDLVTAEDTTPEHVAACRTLIERSGGMRNEGPFTPFLFKAADAPPRTTIQLPGNGGVNWGGVASDPVTGYVFANAQNSAFVGWVEEKVPGGDYGRGTQGSNQVYDRAHIGGPGPYSNFNAPINGYDANGRARGASAPCYRPPWARLVAVDPHRGEIVWAVPLGLNAALPEGKRLVGGSTSAGPTVTAGGLVFVAATNDRLFRAFDARTGEELWVTDLAATQAGVNPMSYSSRSGKQHVAVIAGNRVLSYALP